VKKAGICRIAADANALPLFKRAASF